MAMISLAPATAPEVSLELFLGAFLFLKEKSATLCGVKNGSAGSVLLNIKGQCRQQHKKNKHKNEPTGIHGSMEINNLELM